jgi:hypothetical protein
VGERLEALLARGPAAALEPLRGERAPAAAQGRVHLRLDERLLDRVLEAPARLALEQRVGQAHEVVALGEPLEDLPDLGDGGVGREHGRLVGGRAAEPSQRHDAPVQKTPPKTAPRASTSRSAGVSAATRISEASSGVRAMCSRDARSASNHSTSSVCAARMPCCR